jgi:hypothetical protein
MGRVYTDWRTVPDDPNRVGDYDYDPMARYNEVDHDEYDEYDDEESEE